MTIKSVVACLFFQTVLLVAFQALHRAACHSLLMKDAGMASAAVTAVVALFMVGVAPRWIIAAVQIATRYGGHAYSTDRCSGA